MRTLFRRFLFCLLSTLTITGVFAQTLRNADATFHAGSSPGLRTALLPAIYPSSHAANLLVLRNGDVLCFWFSGTWEGHSNVGIVVSRLPKDSMTWSKPILIDREAGRSFQNPVPFEDAHGRIWLFHTSQAAGMGQANAEVLDVRSHDGGHTWSQPKVLFAKAGSFTRQPMVVVSDGTWLLPMYYTPSAGITKGAASNYSVVKISKDEGKRWNECLIPDSDGLVQPSVLKLGATSYVAFFRSRYADWIYRSTSSDGCHWVPPQPTELPNNNSSMQAVRLADGHIAMAFNNSSGPERVRKPQTGARVPLSVAISNDDGKTWTSVRDLETSTAGSSGEEHFPKHTGRDEFSYPSIVQLPNGEILVAYTYRRYAIKAAMFSEEWVQSGTTEGKFKPGPKAFHK
jgi:predicted neuraminidase